MLPSFEVFCEKTVYCSIIPQMHHTLEPGCGIHMEAGQPCKQLSLPNIQTPPVSGSQSAVAATGTGKGKEGRKADEEC